MPTVESHQGHPTGGGVAGFTQRINEKVAQKISEIVSQGITDIHQVRTLLRHYVMQGDICKGNLPDPNDRGYFPTDTDLRNHIYMAKRALQLSCLDQENMKLKVEQWNEMYPESSHHFRPFVAKKNSENQTEMMELMESCQ